jgi:hypothetical protein
MVMAWIAERKSVTGFSKTVLSSGSYVVTNRVFTSMAMQIDAILNTGQTKIHSGWNRRASGVIHAL